MGQNKHNDTVDNETSEEQENEGSFDRFTLAPNKKHFVLRRKRSNHNKNEGHGKNKDSKDLDSKRGEHGHKGSSRVSYSSRTSSKKTTTKKV